MCQLYLLLLVSLLHVLTCIAETSAGNLTTQQPNVTTPDAGASADAGGKSLVQNLMILFTLVAFVLVVLVVFCTCRWIQESVKKEDRRCGLLTNPDTLSEQQFKKLRKQSTMIFRREKRERARHALDGVVQVPLVDDFTETRHKRPTVFHISNNESSSWQKTKLPRVRTFLQRPLRTIPTMDGQTYNNTVTAMGPRYLRQSSEPLTNAANSVTSSDRFYLRKDTRTVQMQTGVDEVVEDAVDAVEPVPDTDTPLLVQGRKHTFQVLRRESAVSSTTPGALPIMVRVRTCGVQADPVGEQAEPGGPTPTVADRNLSHDRRCSSDEVLVHLRSESDVTLVMTGTVRDDRSNSSADTGLGYSGHERESPDIDGNESESTCVNNNTDMKSPGVRVVEEESAACVSKV